MSLSSVCLGTGSLVRVGAVVLFVAPIVAATACDNDTVLPAAATYSTQLVLVAPSYTIAQNDTVPIDAAVVANDDTVPNPTLTLTSLEPSVVSVDGTDLIGVSPTPAGQPALVVVSFDDANNNMTLTDTASVTVLPGTP